MFALAPTLPIRGALALAMSLALALPAAALRPDPTFGTNGLAQIDPGVPGSRLFAVEPPAFDGDGGILVLIGGEDDLDQTGFSVLGKLEDNGAPSSDFASAGFRTLSAGEPLPRQVLRRPDGRLWVLTTERLDLGSGEVGHAVLYRFGESGNVDASFDFDGRRVLFETESDASMALAADGGVYALAAIDLGGPAARVIKLNADGSPDLDFGASGELALGLPPGSGEPLGVRTVELEDGSLLVLGVSVSDFGQANQSIRCVLWRFNDDGLPTQGFGAGGALVFEMLPGIATSLCPHMVVDGDAVIVAGQVQQSPDPGQTTVDGVLARLLLADGSFDTGFGTGGRVATSVDPTAYDTIAHIALDIASRHILVSHQQEGLSDDLLGLYDADTGQPDPGFGIDGRSPLLLDFGNGPENAWIQRVAVDPAGRTLVTGVTVSTGSDLLWVFRLAGPAVFADGFEP